LRDHAFRNVKHLTVSNNISLPMCIIKTLFINILEISTGAFYIKIMRFAGFLCVQIHSWNISVSWTLQSTSSRRAVWYWAVPPGHSFYILRYLLEWWRESRELWMSEGREVGEIDQSSIIGRIVFHCLVCMFIDCFDYVFFIMHFSIRLFLLKTDRFPSPTILYFPFTNK